MSELRFNPVLREWVITATHRQQRTFLPPSSFCPLCPTEEGGFPTEVPSPDFDLVAFENRFPSLSIVPPTPSLDGTELYPVANSSGVCEVVVYTPDHNSTLADQSPEQILKLVNVWRHRFRELDSLELVEFVFIFENKGEQMGVTLHHPHGQIYGYPFVPPIVGKEIESARIHYAVSGACLFCSILREEQLFAGRIVIESEHFISFIPFFARYPYEVHIYPKRHVTSILELTLAEDADLALILKQTLSAFDRLFDVPFPYVMAFHQRPSDGNDYQAFYHFHIEFYPPIRAKDRLKFLAGSEIGAGVFINDALPEQTAARLRDLVEPVTWNSK